MMLFPDMAKSNPAHDTGGKVKLAVGVMVAIPVFGPLKTTLYGDEPLKYPRHCWKAMFVSVK